MSQTPSPISASELVAPLATKMPDVTVDVEKAASPATPENANPPAPNASQALGRDILGREFDPKKFRPEKDIIGRWKNLKAGRPGRNGDSEKSEKATPETLVESESVIPEDAKPAPAVGQHDKYTLAAEAYTRAAYSLLDGAFAGRGEWMPDSEAEHNGLRDSLAAWLRSRGADDLPPGAAFALAAVGYAAGRVQRPNTATRWRLLWLQIRAWWGNRAAQARLDALPQVESPTTRVPKASDQKPQS